MSNPTDKTFQIAIDTLLTEFEIQFSEDVIERIDSMPARIEQKIAQGLKERSQNRQVLDLSEVYEIIDALVIPEFPMGVTALGALPAGY